MRLYPPMLPELTFPWVKLLLRTIPLLILVVGAWRFTQKMNQRLNVPVSDILPDLPLLFDLQEWKRHVQQLNKEIITPEEKVARLFLLIETYLLHEYPIFLHMPTYQELRAHPELPAVIQQVIEALYIYLYTEQHVTHGEIKQLTDCLLQELP